MRTKQAVPSFAANSRGSQISQRSICYVRKRSYAENREKGHGRLERCDLVATTELNEFLART